MSGRLEEALGRIESHLHTLQAELRELEEDPIVAKVLRAIELQGQVAEWDEKLRTAEDAARRRRR